MYVSLDKPTFDGLELFVDDLGQWAERRAQSDEDEPPARIVGSRYFATMGREPSDSSEGSEAGRSEMSVRVAVTDGQFFLSLSRAEAHGIAWGQSSSICLLEAKMV